MAVSVFDYESVRGFSNNRRYKASQAPDEDADRIGAVVMVQTLQLLEEELRTAKTINKVVPSTVIDDVKNLVTGIKNKVEDISDNVTDLPKDISTKFSDAKTFLGGKVDFVSGKVSSVGDTIYEHVSSVASSVGDTIKDAFTNVTDFIDTYILNPAVTEYNRVRLMVGAVKDWILRTYGSISRWWGEVILKDVSAKNNPALNGLIMVRNFILWMLQIVDKGYVYIVRSALAGILLFVDRISLAASNGVQGIARHVTISGQAVGADILPFATYDDFMAAFPVNTTKDMIKLVWDRVGGGLASLVKSIFDDIERRFKEAGGRIPGLNELLPLKDMIELGTIEAEPIPSTAKLAKRLKKLIKIYFKFSVVLVRKVVVDIIAPIIKAVVTLWVEMLKYVLTTATKYAVRYGKPLLKKIIKIMTAPQQIYSYLVLEGINVAHDERLMAKGIDAKAEGIRFNGDKIRYFANTFGIKSDYGALLFFIGMSTLSGAIITSASWYGGKYAIDKYYTGKEGPKILKYGAPFFPKKGFSILGIGPIMPKTILGAAILITSSILSGKTMLKLPLPQKVRASKDPLRLIEPEPISEEPIELPELFPPTTDERPVEIEGLIQIPGPNVYESTMQDVIRWSYDQGTLENGILVVSPDGKLRIVNDMALVSGIEEAYEGETHGERALIIGDIYSGLIEEPEEEFPTPTGTIPPEEEVSPPPYIPIGEEEEITEPPTTTGPITVTPPTGPITVPTPTFSPNLGLGGGLTTTISSLALRKRNGRSSIGLGGR